MNVDELKIKALLEGLEVENIEEFMREASVSDYRNYGKAYVSAVRNKIEEKEPLFITDVFCHKCGSVMKFSGKTLLSNPQQDEYRCEDCKNIEYIVCKRTTF